jgi:hypothetical protein
VSWGLTYANAAWFLAFSSCLMTSSTKAKAHLNPTGTVQILIAFVASYQCWKTSGYLPLTWQIDVPFLSHQASCCSLSPFHRKRSRAFITAGTIEASSLQLWLQHVGKGHFCRATLHQSSVKELGQTLSLYSYSLKYVVCHTLHPRVYIKVPSQRFSALSDSIFLS